MRSIKCLIIKKYSCLFLFIAINLKNGYSQELKSVQLTQRERRDKIVGKYTYSGAEESEVLLLYKNGFYTYNAYRNSIGKQFSEGTWRRKSKVLELNSTYGANRLPVKINYIQKLNKPSRIGIHDVLNSKGEVIENAIISINNDSITCSTMMDTCIGNYKNIERVKVFPGCGECFSGWIEIKCSDFKALDIIILSSVDFDKYVAFNGKKFNLSRQGLKEF